MNPHTVFHIVFHTISYRVSYNLIPDPDFIPYIYRMLYGIYTVCHIPSLYRDSYHLILCFIQSYTVWSPHPGFIRYDIRMSYGGKSSSGIYTVWSGYSTYTVSSGFHTVWIRDVIMESYHGIPYDIRYESGFIPYEMRMSASSRIHTVWYTVFIRYLYGMTSGFPVHPVFIPYSYGVHPG